MPVASVSDTKVPMGIRYTLIHNIQYQEGLRRHQKKLAFLRVDALPAVSWGSCPGRLDRRPCRADTGMKRPGWWPPPPLPPATAVTELAVAAAPEIKGKEVGTVEWREGRLPPLAWLMVVTWLPFTWERYQPSR